MQIEKKKEPDMISRITWVIFLGWMALRLVVDVVLEIRSTPPRFLFGSAALALVSAAVVFGIFKGIGQIPPFRGWARLFCEQPSLAGTSYRRIAFYLMTGISFMFAFFTVLWFLHRWLGWPGSVF